ncbi:hypothetical protein JX265_008807 [Neoarthrinium moseri]|uniref:Glycosyl transferase CAP10 domain-containing protein n=1 Tax=Neoarthrinium moseri TaxID=1658444 RepID=A0A9P9WHB1_9PEZI|nr:hypothetical protein JX265_008807 [Neoarthrinium moseri]
MWAPQTGSIDVATSAGAALACTALTQFVHSRRALNRADDGTVLKATVPISPRAQSTSFKALWLVSGSIVCASCLRAEYDVLQYFPALTPILLAIQIHQGSERAAPSNSNPRWCVYISDTVSGTSAVALFAILSLTDWDYRKAFLSLIYLAAYLIIYVALTPRAPQGSRIPRLDIDSAIGPLSSFTASILGFILAVETIVSGLPAINLGYTLLSAFAKSLSWFFTIQTARLTSWHIAPAIGTFAIISTLDPFKQTSSFQAASHVAASVVSLGQVIHALPRQERGRLALWTFSLFAIIPYAANLHAIRTAESIVRETARSGNHPVEKLIGEARTDFHHLLQKQSQNYTAAETEYRRRYGIEPPAGFEAWYDFAVSHQSPIIDDYDTIYASVSPFWKRSGVEIARIMVEVQDALDSELWLCQFTSENAKTHCTHPYRVFDRHTGSMFESLLANLPGVIPDVKFLVNHLDEPRVLIPPGSRRNNPPSSHAQVALADMSRQSTWDAITKFCDSNPQDEFSRDRYNAKTPSLQFVAHPASDKDLCQHPQNRNTHGLFMSPTSFRLIEGLVPVLSTGSPSTMGDILFPSPAYMESEFQYDATNDIEWDRKRSTLYWAGSNTGAYASDNQWRQYHRQRFVAVAQNLERRTHYYLREVAGAITSVKSSFLNTRLFDVSFTRIFQCQWKYCRDQSSYFNIKSWADKDEAFRFQLVFDMDGNGISGRYYKLLASRSAPLKQTLLREWHDERLVPWVHYIPVSQSMDELPELVLYLTSTDSGQKRAMEIAEQGREWFSKAFREVDRTIYVYRLLLELARLQDPAREAIK